VLTWLVGIQATLAYPGCSTGPAGAKRTLLCSLGLCRLVRAHRSISFIIFSHSERKSCICEFFVQILNSKIDNLRRQEFCQIRKIKVALRNWKSRQENKNTDVSVNYFLLTI
ncbi:hypothetical protein BpHYR1_047353, partial [Brachionus plicatilis]